MTGQLARTFPAAGRRVPPTRVPADAVRVGRDPQLRLPLLPGAGQPLRLVHRQLALERGAGGAPFLSIVATALGIEDAGRWFEAARRAQQRVVTAEQNRAHHFGFAHHLDVETEAHQELTLPVVAAFEATKALYEVTRRDAAVDVDGFFDCALRACSRSNG